MMHGRNGADVHMPAVGNPILQSQVPLLTNDQMVDDIPSEHQALVSSFMGGGGKRIHPLPFSADPNVPGKTSIRDFCNFANFRAGVLSSEMEASDIGTVPETLIRDTNVSAVIDWEKEVAEIDRGVGEDDSAMKEEYASLADLMVCDSDARMVPGGFNRSDCAREDCVMFVNAGCDEGFRAPDANVEIVAYARYEGGEAFRTEEHVEEAGDCPFIYQSARLGNCCRFDNLAPGHYSIDLHFSEIINTNGPKGMRVFNVFLQDEKVLSEFDIFAVVGSNKPLQIVNLRASVKDDGVMRLKFDGIHGSPLVSGICIKKATNISAHHGAHECKNCSAEIAKLKKRIKELRKQCQPSNDECYEACMSLTAANE